MVISEPKRMGYALLFPLCFILFLWIVRIIEWEFDYDLWYLGVTPRDWHSIPKIFTYTFIHSGFTHLAANTIPLLVLGWILFLFYKEIAPKVAFWLWLLTGLLTWGIGRPGSHIGASGLIYGLVFFLFFSGVFRRDFPLIAVSLVVVFLYGGILWNMFPVAEMVDPNVSWEGHLSGALSGLLLSVLYRKFGPQREPVPEDEEEWPEWAEPPADKGRDTEDGTETGDGVNGEANPKA